MNKPHLTRTPEEAIDAIFVDRAELSADELAWPSQVFVGVGTRVQHIGVVADAITSSSDPDLLKVAVLLAHEVAVVGETLADPGGPPVDGINLQVGRRIERWYGRSIEALAEMVRRSSAEMLRLAPHVDRFAKNGGLVRKAPGSVRALVEAAEDAAAALLLLRYELHPAQRTLLPLA
jgi:hypothetical protein